MTAANRLTVADLIAKSDEIMWELAAARFEVTRLERDPFASTMALQRARMRASLLNNASLAFVKAVRAELPQLRGE